MNNADKAADIIYVVVLPPVIPVTVCPECGGEVLTNKHSGNSFCVSCNYTKEGQNGTL